MASTNILLLDSEPLLREATAILLRRSGGRVRVASSAAEAVAEARERAFDVAVIDVSGSGTAGAEVILAALRAAGCGPSRVVVCTEEDPPTNGARDGAEILRKPYAFARLLRAVFGPRAGGRVSPSEPPRRVPTPRRRASRAPPALAPQSGDGRSR